MDQRLDADLMHRVLQLAESAPVLDPNPRVAALVTDAAGTVLAEGVHQGAGSPHAEVVALRTAGTAARGGTVYVNLEPCRHTGRTGPCTAALLAAGVARVVYAQSDPSALAGGGGRMLADAGVEVVGGVLAERATRLNRTWSFRATSGRPFVTWKYAATLDGYSAAADGTSRWITSAQARADVHRRRAKCGAVLVGTGTVLADDPWLTVRGPDGTPIGRQPIRAVAGLRTVPPGSRVLDDAAETMLLPTRDPHEMLAALSGREVHHVWLEGGPRLAAGFLRARLVDEVLAYLAPVLLGAGLPAVGDLGVVTLADRLRLQVLRLDPVGPDVRVIARPVAASDPAVRSGGRAAVSDVAVPSGGRAAVSDVAVPSVRPTRPGHDLARER